MDEVIKISITGDLGSGKSTVCEILKSKQSFVVYSTGKIQRQIAILHNMSTYELNQYAEAHPEIDDEIDHALMKLSFFDQNIVIDSRMAWHFVQNTFKVYLTTDRLVAAGRVMCDFRGSSEGYTDIHDAERQLAARKRSENARYQSKYRVNCAKLRNFDCVIDTTLIPQEEVADRILAQQKIWSGGDKTPLVLLSPLRLFPTGDMRRLTAPTHEETEKIKILFVNDDFYIFDGHRAVAAHARLGRKVIACDLVAEDNETVVPGISAWQYVRDACSITRIHQWESYNGFSFLSYPNR